MLTFTGTGRRIYVNQSGATFRAAPSAGGGGLCPAFLNTNGVNQDWSVIAWVKPGWAGSSQYTIFALANGLCLKTGSSNIIDARVAARNGTLSSVGSDQNTQALQAFTAGALVLNDWNLVAMSFNSSTKVLRVSVFNSSNTSGSFASSAAYSVVPPTAVEGCPDGMSVGGGAGFADFIGSIGTLAMFGRQASDADLLAIYNTKHYLAPFYYIRDTYSETDYVAFGVSIPSSVVDESGAGIGSTWLVAGTSTTGTSGAAPAAPTAWVYVDSGRSRGASLDTHRPTWINNVGANTCRYDSHDGETFFTRQIPATARTPGALPGASTALLVMYAGLAAASGLHWCIAASNSRGVRRPSAGGQTLPERHSEGYMAEKKSLIAGVMNGRCWESSTEATNAFGLRVAQSETVETAGTKLTMQTTTGWQDFTRAWTGGDNNGAGVSQGMGVILSTVNAAWGLKFTSETGTPFVYTNPMHVRYHVLAYPGHCGSILYRRVRSATQAAGSAIDAADTTVTGFDTTVATRTYNTGTDSYNSGTKTVVINTDLIGQGVRVGHLLVNVSLVSAAEISSISWDGANTTLVLHDALGQTPLNGHVFKFGPWRTSTIEADFAADDPSETRINRGLLIKAPSSFPSNTLGPVILAQDAWATGVDGIVMGHAGYSGNGYNNQLTDCWQYHNGISGDNAIVNFYRKMLDSNMTSAQAMSFSVFLHHADQQVADPGLLNYARTIELVVPEVAVSYMGDQVHGTDSDVVNWDTYVFSQGDRLAVSVAGDSTLGTLQEQYAAGHRTDSAHPTALGHLKCARANIARGGPVATARLRRRPAPGVRNTGPMVRSPINLSRGTYSSGLTARRNRRSEG